MSADDRVVFGGDVVRPDWLKTGENTLAFAVASEACVCFARSHHESIAVACRAWCAGR
jgi:hypothetical protein